MNAVKLHDPCDLDELRYGEVKDPKLRSSTDVIVKLEAAAVNRIDLIMRDCIPGTDGSGTIVSVGADVETLRPGDSVCLYPLTHCGKCRACSDGQEYRCPARQFLSEHDNGTYAEYIRVPAENCFGIPDGFSFEEAAAFPLVYLTAWRMLIHHVELQPGDWILIVGAGGGVATAALHLATAIGARAVVASSSKSKLRQAEELGASYGLDYHNPDFPAEIRRMTSKRGVDVVVDSSGGENWARCLATLARGGRVVSCGVTAGGTPKTDLRRIFWNHLKIFGAKPGSRAEFRELLNFMQASRRRPVIDQVYALHDAKWAHQRMRNGQQFGKIVLRMRA